VLEALQNAGKYAGEGAAATVTVEARDPGLTFVVKDEGAGFDTRDRGMGAGFQNMLDRLGALGGTLRVESAPGRGTQVTGALPATPVEGAPS
jgi:signal transduction histidine kinase